MRRNKMEDTIAQVEPDLEEFISSLMKSVAQQSEGSRTNVNSITSWAEQRQIYDERPKESRLIDDCRRYDNHASSPIRTQELVEAITNSIAASRLPMPEPFQFNGDPLKFPAWKAAFSMLIESRGVEARERIYYLRKYLGEEPRATVESLFYFNTEDSYSRAIEILEKRYGNTFFIAEGFRDSIREWPVIDDEDNVDNEIF
jgi:hypothetical protein